MYHKRIIDYILEKELKSSGAVLIVGPKACGKTTSAKMISNSHIEIDNPKDNYSNKILAELDPLKILQGETPRLIDEWQLVPKLYDAVRHEADIREKMGQFILTGSLSIDHDKIMHTGTGRITRLQMYPLSLYESLDSSGKISLTDLLNNKNFLEKSNMNIEKMSYLICRGGFPVIFKIDGDDSKIRVSRNIYQTIINSDVSKVDGVKRSPILADNILKSLSRNVQTRCNNSTIQKDIEKTSTISTQTIQSYIEALKSLYVIDYTQAWTPNLRSKTAIRTTPTLNFVDPSLACAALNITPSNLLNDLNTFGLLFESLVIRDLKAYMSYHGGKVYNYRDHNGLECDAVLEFEDGRYALIEIKLGDNRVDEGCVSLNKLEGIIDDKKMNKPSFKAVITSKGIAYKRKEDGIYVIPIDLLKY